ncbi:MAG: amino acid adenylation domain-containing protein [Burkholderiales bacterium]|nr:amino acid adenylation domain-containing protein [Burkholderiales bacterium]
MVQDWHEDRSSAAARFEHLPGVQQQGEYDLVLEVVLPAQASQPIVLNWKYDPGLFEDETLARLHRHFAVLLEMVMQRPDTPVAACELVCAEERLGLVRDRNRTEVAYPAHMTTASLFAAQAQRTPQAPAIVFGEQALRYGELHARVERLAAGLRRRGVGPGRLVAVCMERCTDLVAALLGVLQAGGAYIPLDPGYPRERLVDILGDARPQVVLTQQALQASVRGMCRDAMDGRDDVVVAMDGEWIEPASQAGTDARLAATPDDLAYVIYTSGSTGRPKGVMVSHRALTNFLCSMAREPGLAATDRLLAVTTHSFDIAALELFLPLVAGAVCHIADAATVKDAQRLKSLVEAVRPTVMQATPSAWSMLLHAGWRDGQGLRILCGGEAMSEPLKDRLLATGAEVWNMFGPTETTVWSLVERVQPGKPVSIGTPIANTRVYVVDPQGRLSPSGVPGELCIAGDGLARGYLNRPELSAEKFCADPFVPGASMYRTGDLVRWAPDGSLQYLGRMDSQVKVRGFRIELAEIETLLLAHPAVRDGAVVARAQGENKLLVAYYTPEGDGADGAQALQQHLAGRLPDYMVPAFFIQLEALPCTPNGKVDRKSLSERPLRLHGDADAPASTPAPMAPAAAVALDEVLGLWREVLMVEDIRASDGFFDAGGSSVLAAVLAERIAQRFGVVFTATDVFRHPTAAQVHARLNALRAVPAAACRTAPAARASVPFAQELQSTQGAPGMQDAQGARAPAHASGAAADASATGLQGAVAIVGLSCEVPGARNHRAFWRNLLAGHESVTLYTADELHERGVAPWLAAHPRFVPVQSTMAGKAFFDAEFFGISARDAELMDPQARLLLQNAWKAVEDAGYLAEDIADAAVYLSASNSHYLAPLVHDLQHKDSETLVRFMLSQPGTFAAMVSHHLRLKGPSLFVHSNCSSSLAALALGCQAIASGQVRHALVGGASIYAHDSIGYLHEEGMNLSADGHCRAFDAQASGMVGGEGVAVVLLKDAAAALADGDAIYAIVRGAAINNDGGDKAGFYAPSVAGQTAVIRSALARAGVDASTVQYVEAHGTGTRLGDPIEVSALAEAYRDARAVGLGSVKSNLGHLDAAAGLAGLVKCALALREGQVPPSIHFRTPNPQARFEATPFQVLDRVTPLRSDGGPARAAVSSFGIGGTNVHAVLEAAPAVGGGAQAGGARLVPLSARKPANLRCMARELADELQRGMDSGTAPRLADVAFTLQVGRLAQPVRAAFVVHELPELVAALRGLAGGHDAMAPPQSLAEAGLLDDEDRQQLVQRWISAGRLDKLARFWQAGGTVHWARLHGPHDRPRRVNLPAYAFSEDAHWIAREVQPVSAAQDTMVKPSEATLFEERWVEAPLPEGVQVAAAQGRRERIVCLFDDATGRQHLRQALQALNPQAELLFLAQDPSAGAEAGCLAVEGGEHGLDTALQTVARDGAQVDAVYWLGPVQDAGCLHDLAFPGVLLRALQRAGLSAGQVLLAGSFTDAVEQALLDALVGYERSVARAWPGSVVRVLMHAGTATPEQWVHLLHRELHHGGHASVMVRDGRRLACRVRPMDGAAPGTGFAFKRGGTYVVTGAFRGLGRRVAEHLARRYQAKLVLLGRSVPGEKELAWIAGLADAGCEVQHASVDVADLQALQAVHAALPPAWRQVDGVLHVAGVDQPASLLEQDAAAFERVLRPKVPGTLALERVFGAQGQALMCAFSSSAAVQGDFGGCDYAVANRFQWAYARALREWQGEGSRMVAIGWPLWEEGGMGAATRQRLQPQALQAYLAASGQAPLPTRTALALLERLLGEGHVQPLVINADPVRAGALLKSTGGMAPAVAGPAVAAPVGDPLQQALAAELHSLAQQLLKQPEQALDEDRPFVDLGFDSIRLMQLATRMSERLGVKLLPALFYDHPTIGQIAGHVAAVHAEALAARWPAAALRAPQEPASAPAGAGQDGTAPPAPASSPSKEHATALHEPIAIIGMSGLFPQADSVPAFWQMVAGQQHAVGPVPAARWGWHAADSTSELRCRWMGCLDAVDAFDAQFFEIAPKEARVMDPRQRLLLQEAWKALDDAALGPLLLGERRVGVFVGVEQGDYQYLVQDGGNVTSNHDGVLAARLSYFLDFKGPVMALNTACSSGLVALHQACMSLRQGECDIAVVAAANLLCTPGAFVAMDRAGMLSPSGRCRTFDRHADGMVPGEAVVALVLEPLARAQAEGDPVHSVVVASAINCDGRTNGITAPAGPAQQALLEDIYVRQGVDPAGIGLVVAHGTGTRLGDPVEVQALNAVFGPRMPPGARCALASTKTHVGHTFAASGLVSLAALSQALAHGVLPASLHCEEESDYIEWRDSPFYVNKKAGPWPTAAGRRRMGGVSAFGMSGTNAHVVLAEAPAPAALAAAAALPAYLLPVSAKTEAALERALARLAGWLQETALRDEDLARLSHTLWHGRHHFRHRSAIIASSVPQALQRWSDLRAGQDDAGCFRASVDRSFKPSAASHEAVDALLAQAGAGSLPRPAHEAALAELARWYVQGHPIDAARLHPGRPLRLRLPAYPFAADRHWVDDRLQATRDAAAPATAADAALGHSQPAAVQADSRVASKQPLQRRPTPHADESAPMPQAGKPARQPLTLADPATSDWPAPSGAAAPGAKPTGIGLSPLPEAPTLTGGALRPHDVLEDLKSAADIGFGGMVATLNRTGVMVECLIPYSSDFADYAGHGDAEVLDLGCAYGVATIAALECGARVMAVDMAQAHLDILAQRVSDEARCRLSLMQGVLPDIDFEPGRFAAIHASRVLHFLRPQDVQLTLRKMFSWLKPGGRIFLSSDSPYFGYWAAKATEYEQRKRQGDPWPGFIDDVQAHFPPADVMGGPNQINALDPDVFTRECEAAGFVVERADFFGAVGVDRQAHLAPGPDMEHAGVIAVKPAGRREPPAGPRFATSRDGNAVRLEVRGSGETALVFIHGLGCDGSYWDAQVQHFASRHTVLCLDLAGHGGSGRERARWTVQAFADDVAAAIEHAGLKEVIVVGHSLGGPVMLELPARVGARVRGLVGVDTLHNLEPRPMDPARLDAWLQAYLAHPLDLREMFAAGVDPALVERVRRTRAATGAEVIHSAMREMILYMQALPPRLPGSLTLINSSGWMPTSLDTARRRGVTVELLDGVGHFPMLEAPQALNALIEKAIRPFLKDESKNGEMLCPA